MKESMELVGVRLTPQMVKVIDQLVKKGHYPNRSEVLRDAFRKLYLEYLRIKAAKSLPKDYDSVKSVRELKKKKWEEALRRAKGNVEKAQDIIIEGPDILV